MFHFLQQHNGGYMKLTQKLEMLFILRLLLVIGAVHNVGKPVVFLQEMIGLLNGLTVYSQVVINFGGDGQVIQI